MGDKMALENLDLSRDEMLHSCWLVVINWQFWILRKRIGVLELRAPFTCLE
jgi:hypothetical protein